MKICCFFGAGAESSFGLSGGKDFAKVVLGVKEEVIDEAIEEYYKDKDKSYDSWYPEYPGKGRLVIGKDSIYKAAIKKKHFELEKEFDNKTKFENQIKSELNELNEQDKENLLTHYTSYMDLIDNYFHTLIAPKYFGPHNFWKVVSCYTRAYLYLVGQILYKKSKTDKIIITKDMYVDILKYPKSTMDKILDKCQNEQETNSYYKVLSEYQNEICVITTNYTPLCRCITNNKNNETNDNIAYLNGRFGLFESARELRVYDVEEDELPKNEVLFPYIFIQSGVKPIIDIKQLREYNKAIRFLDEVDELIIVGYEMNGDDNHINSLIRSFLLENKKITFFKFNGSTNENKENKENKENENEKNQEQKVEDEKNNILKKLRLFGKDKELCPKFDINIIFIKDDNSVSEFAKYLEAMKMNNNSNSVN